MRIPFPSRVNPRIALVIAVMVAVVEIAEGTNPFFALLAGTFIMLTVSAFNLVGGFTYPSGAFIAALSILDFILAQFVKIILIEPADKNLRAPLTTAGAYVVSMAGILVAAWLSRRFLPRKAILQFDERDLPNLPMTAIGLLVVGGVIQALTQAFGTDENGTVVNGTIWTFLQHFSQLVPLSIVVGTFYVIRTTGGRRSVAPYTVAAVLYISLLGLISASKEGMLTGMVAYLLVCAFLQYRFNRAQVIGLLAAVALFVLVLYPWAQWGRNYINGNRLLDKAGVTFRLLLDPQTYALMYENTSTNRLEEGNNSDKPHYFDRSHGILDRWALVAVDDALIDLAERQGPVGTAQLQIGFLNVLPRFIYEDKGKQGSGNLYSHDLGLIGDEDTSTGISFSLIGTGFYEMGWLGVLIAVPMIAFVTFTISDSLMGNVIENPWGILYSLIYLHTAPEGVIDGYPGQWVYFPLALTITVWFSKNGAPLIATLVGRSRRKSPLAVVSRVPEPPLDFKPTLAGD